MSDVVRERTLILTQDTSIDKMRIEYALYLFGNDTKVNLRPGYQRDLRWVLQQYFAFVDTIMTHGYIPNIVLYKLHPEDERTIATHQHECIDGQHRLNCINKFKASEPISINGKEEMIAWHHKSSNTNVFYVRNEHTENWQRSHPDKKVGYFTEKEMADFNECRITIEQINCKLTYEQRCAMFVSLQQGTPVRNSDLFKNYIDIPIIAFISMTIHLESKYRQFVSSRLTADPKQNWLFCVVRLCLIANASSYEDRILWVDTTDTQIKEMINKKMPSIMNIAEPQAQVFHTEICRWFSILNALPKDTKFTPIQMVATFVQLQEIVVGEEHLLSDRLTDGWAGKGSKAEKKMWYQKDNCKEVVGGICRRKQYFNECIDYLCSSSPPRLEVVVSQRKSLSKKNRKLLWGLTFGKKTEGQCFVCEKVIEQKSDWHAGHLLAHAKGGSDVELDNFVVECAPCNLAHGTEDPRLYKKRNY